MKKIINFKENIFKKINVPQFSPQKEIKEDLTQIIQLKKDLKEIQKIFGKYDSREIILVHNKNLPPKTKRCFDEILNMDKKITYSTSRFKDFNNENVKLEILLNFELEAINNAINYVDNVIELCLFIQKNNYELSIITNTVDKMPNVIKNFLKIKNMQKTKISKFISNIQSHYKKLFLKSGQLTGKFVVTFSSIKTKEEFIENNDVDILKNITDKKIIVKSNKTFDTSNIIKINKTFKMEQIPNISEHESYNPDLKKINDDCPTIGILDSKIPDNSPFKNLIKITNYLNNNDIIHHGEAVSSIAFAGDQLNGFDDGCGPFNVHLFEIFENNVDNFIFIERIKMAIESNPHIKVWNLSINSPHIAAFEDGMVTDFASFLDKIQTKNKILIVQSSGNKKIDLKTIMSPSDAVKSLVVNATKTIQNQEPAKYALDESSKYYTKKPDVSFFGGDDEEKVIALKNSKTIKITGTSFASPFVARKAAQLIYYEGMSILEAKAMIIHASYVNSFENENQKNGWGVVPKNIDQITNSKNSHIRFIFKEKIKDTKSGFMELKIPQHNKQEYSVLMTVMSSERVDEKYGCEYVRSAVNANMGPIDTNDKFIPHRKLKHAKIIDDSGEPILDEKKLIKEYNKWKLTDCLQDIIKRDRNGNARYGINAKIDKRMSEINNQSIEHDLVCIVTLIHKEGQDKYKKFIEINTTNIINVDLTIEGNINIKNLK